MSASPTTLNGSSSDPPPPAPPSSSRSPLPPSSMSMSPKYPLPRRSRCLSCSDQGHYLDLSLDDDKDVVLPDVIVTRRTRSDSVSGRIQDQEEAGVVKYFCRSRGHGFITPDSAPHKELFMHISDIEGEYVPRKGDRVKFHQCPIPPRFEKFQAVHVHIVNFTPEVHRRWEMPETPEELEEEKQIKSPPYDV